MKILVFGNEPSQKNANRLPKIYLCGRCDCVFELGKSDLKSGAVKREKMNVPEPGGGSSEMTVYTFPCPNARCKHLTTFITDP